MPKKLRIIGAAIVVLIIGFCGYRYMLLDSMFHGEEGGLFVAAEFDPQYAQIERTIDVPNEMLEHLVFKNNIQLNAGSVKMEVYNPAHKKVYSTVVDEQDIFLKTIKTKSIKGQWKIIYYTNKLTDGTYNVTVENE